MARISNTKGEQIRYEPQKVNRPEGTEMSVRVRVGNRTGAYPELYRLRSLGPETNCPFELGFRVSIACRMAVESYRRGKTVRWDPVKEEIV